MSIGTYLIGAGLFLLIAAYVGSPLNRTKFDADKVVERWVTDARLRLEKSSFSSDDVSDGVLTATEVVNNESVNFCPQCGRRVEVDHRFCPGCGTPLSQGAVR